MQLDEESFYAAIWKVEGDLDPWPPLGDDGRALGPCQLHPEFVQQWRPVIPYGQSWTWVQFLRASLGLFYTAAAQAGVDDAEAACGFHYDGQVRYVGGDPDGYAAKFKQAAGLT